MAYTVGHLARYIDKLLPVTLPNELTFKEVYRQGGTSDLVWSGIEAYKEFLSKLLKALDEDPDLSVILKKGKEKFSDEVTLSTEFPMVNNIKSVLLNLGMRGVLSEDKTCLLIEGWDQLSLKYSLNKNSTTKISKSQMIKTLKFMSHLGLNFTGLDLGDKNLDTSSSSPIEVTYFKNNHMLLGLKTLGLGHEREGSRKNDDILLRCDYRSLLEDVDQVSITAFLDLLPEDHQASIKKIHDHSLLSGLTCDQDKGFLCHHLIYSYKRKEVWRLSASFYQGYRLKLKTKHQDKYQDLIETFPQGLRDLIKEGYGCDRKQGSGHGNCQKGCEGFRLMIDDSLVDQLDTIKIWQSHEVLARSPKK